MSWPLDLGTSNDSSSTRGAADLPDTSSEVQWTREGSWRYSGRHSQGDLTEPKRG